MFIQNDQENKAQSRLPTMRETKGTGHNATPDR